MFYIISFLLIIMISAAVFLWLPSWVKYENKKQVKIKSELVINTIIVFMTIIPFIALYFGFIQIGLLLQKIIFIKSGYRLILESSIMGMLGSVMFPSFCIMMMINNIILKKYDIDSVLEKLRIKNLKKNYNLDVNNAKDNTTDKEASIFISIVFVICFPFYVLGIGNYLYATDDQIIVSRYFSFTEVKYEYNEIKEISVKTNDSDGANSYSVIIKFIDNKSLTLGMYSANLEVILNKYKKDINFDTTMAENAFYEEYCK
ncbi:MAG: hypothetical protein ACM3O4_01985 [Ignavibacteriales bacterium]